MSRTSLVSAIFSCMWIFFCTKGSVDPISFSFSFPFWRFSLSDSSEHWSSIVSIFSINCLKPTGGGILARARCVLCGLSCLARGSYERHRTSSRTSRQRGRRSAPGTPRRACRAAAAP